MSGCTTTAFLGIFIFKSIILGELTRDFFFITACAYEPKKGILYAAAALCLSVNMQE